MRVVHVVRSDSFGGVERYISLVAPRLAKRGCEVTVVGGERSRMRQISGPVQCWTASTTREATSRLARLGRVDLVHAHMTAAEIAAVATKPWHRARLLATRHFASARGSTRGAHLLPLLRGLDRALDCQIAISQFVADATGVPRVLHHGVEVVDTGRPQRRQAVLVMQRLEEEKHTDVALRAWASTQLRASGWQLIIAGRGSQEQVLKRLSDQLGISESVVWPGFIDDPSDLLRRVAILLAPAPADGFGLTVVEAMANGTPVIAADGGAHRETIGIDGWLFPVGDAPACGRLLDDASRRDMASYGTELQIRQRRQFDVEGHVDELLLIYNELL